MKKKAKTDVSMDDIQNFLWKVLEEKKGQDAYLRDVYPGYLIYGKDDKYFKVGWSLLDGEITLGSEETEVEKTWVEARSQQAETEEALEALLRLDQVRDPEGLAWDVTICEPGLTLNGWLLEEDVLQAAAGLFENVDVNLYELPDRGATHVPDVLFDIKSLLVKNKVGWIDSVRYAAGQGLKGVLHFLDSAKWLGKNLLGAMQAGAQVYGLSYDCPVRARKDSVNGKTVFKAVEFLAADSVDIVSRPAAGGKFNRAIAAQKREVKVMDKQKLWEMIAKARPDLLKGKDIESVTDEEVVELARMAMEPPQEQENKPAGGADDDPGTGQGPETATKDELKALRCEMDLRDKLAECDLPRHAQKRVEKAFKDRLFESEDLERAIADEKDYLAEVSGQAGPEGGDGGGIPAGSIVVGLGTVERMQMAVDRMFGLTKEDMEGLARMERLDRRPFFEDMRSVQDYQEFDQVPTFRGLLEMYTFFTGDPEVTGFMNRKKLPPDLRASADITSATFTYVLGNTLGRRLVKDYLATDFQEDLLISIRKPVKDFRQQEAVLVGYFGDLDDVDPEAADYDEIAAVTDEESTYSLGQKGNILSITRKTIINDDISLIQRLVGRLGRAARRTHAKYVWNFFINNSNCSDGTAWFTSGHGNLGSNALSFAYAIAAYQALGKMTEKDSAERIGLLDDPNVKPALVYPIDLMPTAESIVEDEFYFSTNDLTTKTRNPLRGKIKGAQLSLLTDVDDWGLIMPPDVIDIVEMGYLNGRQEPEMFIADSPQSEQVFVADKIRHKIRHEYAGSLVDYRSGYKKQ